MFLRGEPYEPKSVDHARSLGIDTVYQDLALIDELSVFHNMFLRREKVAPPAAVPGQPRRCAPRRARALDEIGINIPSLNAPVARLSGGQRQAIAVARTVHSEADILLLDEPLAAMGAKEGARILDLIERLKDEGEVSMILVLHNYVHVLASCDRVNLIQDGVIAFDKPTSRDLDRGADRARRRASTAGRAGRPRRPSPTLTQACSALYALYAEDSARDALRPARGAGAGTRDRSGGEREQEARQPVRHEGAVRRRRRQGRRQVHPEQRPHDRRNHHLRRHHPVALRARPPWPAGQRHARFREPRRLPERRLPSRATQPATSGRSSGDTQPHRRGAFSIDGNPYTLDINNPPNSLHGGFDGFNTQVWDASPIEQPDRVGVSSRA